MTTFDFNDKHIFDTITNIMEELYSRIEAYLEYIFNSPSTINKLVKYYAIGFSIDEPNKRFIMFGSTVVKEFELILPETDLYRGIMND